MPNLLDVAHRAKVSIASASRSINNAGKVSLETQRSVHKAMAELGYRPNRVARRLRLRSGKRHLLGLIIPNIQNPFFSEMVRGIESVAYQHQFAVLLCNYDEDAAKEAFYVDVMQSESVDGIIVPPMHERDPAVLKIARSGLPMVCVDRTLAGVEVDKVEVDNRRGSYEAVAHLIARGHKRIGLIAGPVSSSTGRERRRGYLDALAALGVPVRKELIRTGDYKQESGQRLTDELLSLRARPTALFVSNNLMTIGALETIHARNLRIPSDIAIIGYDDIPLAQALNPPLTLVRQPAYEVGRCAAELLFKRLEEPGRPASSVLLNPQLILRQSC